MPRRRKVSRETCEAGEVIEITVSLHPNAFRYIEGLLIDGTHGSTIARVCEGLLLSSLRREIVEDRAADRKLSRDEKIFGRRGDF